MIAHLRPRRRGRASRSMPGDDPELVNQSFGMNVDVRRCRASPSARCTSARDPLWIGGHESAGVTAPSPSWFLAEGATGAFFDTFVLLANPIADAEGRHVHVLCRDPARRSTMTRTIPGDSRLTINIEAEDPSTRQRRGRDAGDVDAADHRRARAVLAAIRAPQWYEAHNSFGVTAPARKWGLAEGRVGGPRGAIRPTSCWRTRTNDAEVTITFLREDGAAPPPQTFTVPPRAASTCAVGRRRRRTIRRRRSER